MQERENAVKKWWQGSVRNEGESTRGYEGQKKKGEEGELSGSRVSLETWDWLKETVLSVSCESQAEFIEIWLVSG